MNNKELKKEVANLIREVEKTHRYSMSRIYGLYNEVFGKDEVPQSCASCLIRKVNELKSWLDTENAKEPVLSPEDVVEAKTKKGKKGHTNKQ